MSREISDQQDLPNDHVLRLVQSYFGIEQQQLKIQSHLINSLAARFGTPCFVYDQSVLESNLQRLQSVYGRDFSIYYSLKANPDPEVVRFFVNSAAGIEVASLGEFRKAIQCGCAPENILFAGPGKTEADLHETIRCGIGEIHAESELELKRIDDLGRSIGRAINVCLRINPEPRNQAGAMRMGGLAAPFGIDEERVPDVIKRASGLDHVAFRGIHLFAGTQILDAEMLISQYRHFVGLAKGFARLIGGPLATIDFGGGLGVPYFPAENQLDMETVRSGVSQCVQEIKSDPLLCDARLVLEPGRFLTAEAGIYVVRVVDIKESRGVLFAITDGGMHHHLAATGNLGQVIKRNFPMACLNRLGQPLEQEYEVTGPLCTPLDRLGRRVRLPGLQVGDLIGLFCSGAYARSASPNDFLSHETPFELFVQGDSVKANRVVHSEQQHA